MGRFLTVASVATAFSFVGVQSAQAWSNPSVSAVSPFAASISENFESYANNEGTHHLFAQNDSVFGGHATMATSGPSGDKDPFTGLAYPGVSNSLLRTFDNSQDFTNGWGTGRTPQYWKPHGGSYGLGVGIVDNDPSGMYDYPLTINFNASDNLHYFGGYFGTAGNNFKVRFRFFDKDGNLIGGNYDSTAKVYTSGDIVEDFTYGSTTTDWTYKWLGYHTDVAIAKVQISGYFMVADDLEAAVVPEPATLAALGLGLAAIARRRKQA